MAFPLEPGGLEISLRSIFLRREQKRGGKREKISIANQDRETDGGPCFVERNCSYVSRESESSCLVLFFTHTA